MEMIMWSGIMFTSDIQENKDWLMLELNLKEIEKKNLNSQIHSNIYQINFHSM